MPMRVCAVCMRCVHMCGCMHVCVVCACVCGRVDGAGKERLAAAWLDFEKRAQSPRGCLNAKAIFSLHWAPSVAPRV